tara:strand:- start:587 stop:991 length:405 start_codon:yes stop_codon:yes gene_type:complete
VVYNNLKDNGNKPGEGFFYIVYDELLHIYQYKINLITKQTTENKCFVKLIYQGEVIDVTEKETLVTLIKNNYVLPKDGIIENITKHLDGIENDYPIFRVRYEEKFPLDGAILSIAKRKIMNYIFQTIKIQELRS